jgi:hypothetical protein
VPGLDGIIPKGAAGAAGAAAGTGCPIDGLRSYGSPWKPVPPGVDEDVTIAREHHASTVEPALRNGRLVAA